MIFTISWWKSVIYTLVDFCDLLYDGCEFPVRKLKLSPKLSLAGDQCFGETNNVLTLNPGCSPPHNLPTLTLINPNNCYFGVIPVQIVIYIGSRGRAKLHSRAPVFICEKLELEPAGCICIRIKLLDRLPRIGRKSRIFTYMSRLKRDENNENINCLCLDIDVAC